MGRPRGVRRREQGASANYLPYMIRRLAPLLALSASLSHAQLDLGTGDVPQSEVDAYLEPFYEVIASGLGQGRFAPGMPGGGFEAGFQAGLVPLPDREAFETTSLSSLPFFRGRLGGRWGGAALMARGMAWSDPRMGDLAAFGGGLAWGMDFLAEPLPVRVDLDLGWDRLIFSSEYTYKYRGSALGLFDQDIPGDYTLSQQVMGLGATLSARPGRWIPYGRIGFDRASGRFSYLYLDPRDDKTRRVRSDLDFPLVRGALGLFWRGIRVEASVGPYLSLEAGWSFFYP